MANKLSAQRFKILSIDGGGVNGALAASILAQMEASLDDPNARLADYFDLIAGTSTGGLIALGLALGKPAEEILDLYQTKSSSIFLKRRSHWLSKWLKPRSKWHDNSTLDKYVSDFFGQSIVDDAKCRLLIPVYNGDAQRIQVFKTRHHDVLKVDYKYKMKDIALATSAAPIYFDCYKFEAGTFWDGGIWANNPVDLAVIEAVRYLGCDPYSIDVLSLGGIYNVFPDQKIRGYSDINRLLERILDAQSKGATARAKTLLGDIGLNYDSSTVGGFFLRLEQSAQSGEFKLDKAEKIEKLVSNGQNLYRSKAMEITDNFLNSPVAPFSKIEAPTSQRQ